MLRDRQQQHSNLHLSTNLSFQKPSSAFLSLKKKKKKLFHVVLMTEIMCMKAL